MMFVLKKTYDAKVAEHGLVAADYVRLKIRHDALTAKFKEAITDLAASRDQVAELLPDAEAMRRKRQMDRDRKAAKKEGV